MTRLLHSPLLLAVLLSAQMVAAPVRAAVPSSTSHDLLVLRVGTGGGATFVRLSAGATQAGRPLPLGLFDRSGQTLYVATDQGSGQSLLRAVDVASGRVLRALSVVGSFSTRTGEYAPDLLTSSTAGANGTAGDTPLSSRLQAPQTLRVGHGLTGGIPADATQMLSALSFNGRWLALRDTTPSNDSRFIVLDTAAMRVIRTVVLPGFVGLDAISADGARLYLVESMLQYGPHAYQVRLYDLRRGRLDPTAVKDASLPTGSMNGIGWTRAWSPDGHWLFTLYVHPGSTGAFIHALSLQGRVAHCIDLPDGSARAVDLAHYTLAVSPDGTTLYAINSVLGHVVAVRGGLPYRVPVLTRLTARAGSPQMARAGAVLSPDGQTLFVATDGGVWAVDAHSFTLRATYLAGQKAASVALTRDGQRLYVLQPDRGRVIALEPRTGQVLGSVSAQAGAWAIEQVMK